VRAGGENTSETGIEHVQQRAGIVVGVWRDFRERDMAGCPHEILELAVRHRRAVDQESFHRDAMDRRFLRIMPVRSHAECAAGNEAHVGMPLAPIGKR
jgi:hypothetical protein